MLVTCSKCWASSKHKVDIGELTSNFLRIWSVRKTLAESASNLEHIRSLSQTRTKSPTRLKIGKIRSLRGKYRTNCDRWFRREWKGPLVAEPVPLRWSTTHGMRISSRECPAALVPIILRADFLSASLKIGIDYRQTSLQTDWIYPTSNRSSVE